MLWLFSQMFVLYLVSFGVGSLMTWLSVRNRLRPEQPLPRLVLPAPRRAAPEEVVVDQPPARKSLPLKGNSKTMVYHTSDSPYYNRMKGDMAFTSETEAVAAGYRMWTTKARVKV